jgi:hypothetical protein
LGHHDITIFFAATTSMLIEGMILVGSIFVLRAWGQVARTWFKGGDRTVPTPIYPFSLSLMVSIGLFVWLTSRPQFGGPSAGVKEVVIFISFVASFFLLLIARHLVRRDGEPATVATGCKALLVITVVYFVDVMLNWPIW